MVVAADAKMTAILNVGIITIKIIQIMAPVIQVVANLVVAWMIAMYVQADAVIVVRMGVKEIAEVAAAVAVIVVQVLVLVVQVLVLVAATADVKPHVLWLVLLVVVILVL